MEDIQILQFCSQFTMTSTERQMQTLASIKHIIHHNITGDIVEVGVWRGGTVMIMLLKLLQMGITDRHVHLYDTFFGMTEASPQDNDPRGNNARDIFNEVKCECSIETVYQNVKSTNYPMDRVHFHQGDIRKVNINDIPSTIAVLRLDNDWYELYKFELPLFEPRVPFNGIVTIDDYGYWSGCKKAIDEYIDSLLYKVDVEVIDDCGIYWIVKNRPENSCTIVTCYYKLHNSKHSDQEYESWMCNFLCTNESYMVIFCDSSTIDLIQNMCAGLKHKTHIIKVDMCDLYCERYHQYWLKDEQRKDHPANNANLFTIWQNKSSFVSEAINLNIFNTQYFCWCDIGCFRDPVNAKKYVNFPLIKNVKNEHMYLQSMQNIMLPEYYDKINRMKNNEIPVQNFLSRKYMNDTANIAGAIFLGHVNAWKWWIPEYYKTLEWLMSADEFCGMDQDVMAIVAISNKDKVNITQSDDWFNFQNSYINDYSVQIYDTRDYMSKFIKLPQNSTIVEIGVFQGLFSQKLLEMFKPETLHLIDPYVGILYSGDKDGNNLTQPTNGSQLYQSVCEKFSGNTHVNLIRDFSTCMKHFQNDMIDLVYIDGDHSYEGVKYDLYTMYDKVKNNGWICGHDFQANPEKLKIGSVGPGCKQAVIEFCEDKHQRIAALFNDGCVSFAIQVVK